MKKDFFKQKADSYETVKYRVENVNNIANSIKNQIQFSNEMCLMDFGSGTGLLLERIAPLVKKITAIDVSISMNEQLRKKADTVECDLEILEMDLTKEELSDQYDGIISSMTMHHIKEVEVLFSKFHQYLNEGGFIAIADLDEEDGSFHKEDTGVHHFGFKRNEFEQMARKAGFKEIKIIDSSISQKEQGDYPVFLMTAYK